MKVKIEKLETGLLRLTIAPTASGRAIVVEGPQLDQLLAMLDVARRAERFTMEVEVR